MDRSAFVVLRRLLEEIDDDPWHGDDLEPSRCFFCSSEYPEHKINCPYEEARMFVARERAEMGEWTRLGNGAKIIGLSLAVLEDGSRVVLFNGVPVERVDWRIVAEARRILESTPEWGASKGAIRIGDFMSKPYGPASGDLSGTYPDPSMGDNRPILDDHPPIIPTTPILGVVPLDRPPEQWRDLPMWSDE